jgi:hypothetical protein
MVRMNSNPKTNSKTLKTETLKFQYFSLLAFQRVTLLAFLLLAMCVSAFAQTNPPPPASAQSFFSSVQNYFTAFNTNLDDTFQSRGNFWTGVDSIQGGDTPLANALGLSYTLYKKIDAHSVTRTGGVAGGLISQQAGLGLSFVVHDARLTLYADAGYELEGAHKSLSDRLYGEVGVRASKALTEHTYAGVGIGGQFPANRQVFSVFAGFTF